MGCSKAYGELCRSLVRRAWQGMVAALAVSAMMVTLLCCLGLCSGQNTEKECQEKLSGMEEEMAPLSPPYSCPPPPPRCSKKGKLVV